MRDLHSSFIYIYDLFKQKEESLHSLTLHTFGNKTKKKQMMKKFIVIGACEVS